MLKLALLGDPVEHSLSPRMQNAAMQAMGIEGEYIAMRVSPGEFAQKIEALKRRGFRGANITIPHKKLAREIATPDDEASHELGVANTLLIEDRILCRNTDAAGFIEALGSEAAGTALIVGAGGAALAAIWALSRAEWHVKVWSRKPDDAINACRFPRTEPVQTPDPTGSSLVVNATPLGLHLGEMPPGEWEKLESHALVFDMSYRDGPTDLLVYASNRGNRTVDGREMLVAQGALSLEWWTRVPVPREAMRAAVGL